jgi:flagellar biosynthesis protein FlhB
MLFTLLDVVALVLASMAITSASLLLAGMVVLLLLLRFILRLMKGTKKAISQCEETTMKTVEAVKKSSFQSQINAIAYVSVITFFAAVVVTVFTGTPRFGFYVVSLGSIYICYQITAIVFISLLGLVGIKRVYDARKVTTKDEALQEFEETISTQVHTKK